MNRETASSADHDFADLNHRGQVGIVRDISHDLLHVWPKAGLECLGGIAKDVTHCDIGRGSAGSSTGKALVHGVGLASIAETSLHQWHVLVAIILVVEARAWCIRIHDA